jgi:hypothetical protein
VSRGTRGLVLLYGIGTWALPSWGFEDEVEQSLGRPCRQTGGSSKQTREISVLTGHRIERELITELQANVFFKSLPEDQTKRLLTGEHFYIRGVRKATEQSAKWDTEKYMSLYSYFSSHAHSAPMSFFRMRQQKIKFSEPSEFQMAMVVSALGVAEYSLLKATLAHLASSPDCRPRFRAEELAEMEETLKGWKSHFEKSK